MAAAKKPAPPELGKPNVWLVLLGLLVIAAVVAGVYYARHTGTKVTEITVGTTKTTTTHAAPSDTLLGVAMGVGAALLLTGILWSRIKSVTLPGGTVVTLDSDEVGQAKDTVAKKAVDENMAAPPVVATATTRTLAELSRRKAQKGTLDSNDYDEAVTQVFQRMQQTAL